MTNCSNSQGEATMPDSIDRRRFLGSAAIGVAASGLSVAAKSNIKYDSPNTRVVVGIMGRMTNWSPRR